MHDSFRLTREKITKLLKELRSWEQGETNATVEDLAKRFDLDTFVVDRIAQSEGIRLPTGTTIGGDILTPSDAVPSSLDDQDTLPLHEDEVDENAITGVFPRRGT